MRIKEGLPKVKTNKLIFDFIVNPFISSKILRIIT